MKTTLSPLEEAFVERYCTHFSLDRAARKVGIASAKASYEGLAISNRPHFDARIKEVQAAQHAYRCSLADSVYDLQCNIAFARPSKFVRVGSNGAPEIDLSTASVDDMDALARVRVVISTEGTGLERHVVRRVSVRLHDKVRALKWLYRRLNKTGSAADATQRT